MLLRSGWILGLISTRRYAMYLKRKRFGSEAVGASACALERLERSLFEDRLAVILFLAGIVVMIYTFLNAPAFRA